MKNRIVKAINTVIAFLRNPTEQLETSDDSYKDLLYLSTVILSLTFIFNFYIDKLITFDFSWDYLFYIPAAISIALVFAWLTLNFYALIFDWYMNKVVNKKIPDIHSNLLLNRRTLVYASIPTLIFILPIPHLYYLIILIETAIIGYGIAIYYNLALRKSLIIAAIFNTIWEGSLMMLVNIIS